MLMQTENDERQWDVQFAESADELEKLADKALTEYAEGRTEVLDLAKLQAVTRFPSPFRERGRNSENESVLD